MGKPKKIKKDSIAKDSLINVAHITKPRKLTKKERRQLSKELEEEKVLLQNMALTPIDWTSVELAPFTKNFYKNNEKTSKCSIQEVENYRIANGITVLGASLPKPILNFDESCFPDSCMEIIRSNNLKEPTPIQAQSWPIAMSGLNFFACRSDDCRGKILSFILPAIAHCQAQPPAKYGEGPIVLVLVKLSDLGQKIQRVANELGSSIRTVSVGKNSDQSKLNVGAEILTIAPQRAVDLLIAKKLSLKRCTCVVLYDAEKLVDDKQEPLLAYIFSQIRPDRQVIGFCNKLTLCLRRIASDLFGEFLEFNVAPPKLMVTRNIKQHITVCHDSDKGPRLKELILKIYEVENPGKIIIFAASNRRTEKITRFIGFFLEQRPLPLNGDKSVAERNRIVADIKSGKANILVTTDSSFRNHIVCGFNHIINFDFPLLPSDYSFRLMRTGIKDEPRSSYTFFTRRDALFAPELIEVMRQSNQFVHRSLEHMARLGAADPVKKIPVYYPRLTSGLMKNIATGTGGTLRTVDLKIKKIPKFGTRGGGKGFTDGNNDDLLVGQDLEDEYGSDDLADNSENEGDNSTQAAESANDGFKSRGGETSFATVETVGLGDNRGGLPQAGSVVGFRKNRGGIQMGGGAGFGNDHGRIQIRSGAGFEKNCGSNETGRSTDVGNGLHAGGGAGFGNDRRRLHGRNDRPAGCFGPDRGAIQGGAGADFGYDRGHTATNRAGHVNNRGGGLRAGGGAGFGNNRGGFGVRGSTGFGDNRDDFSAAGGGSGFGKTSGGFQRSGGAGFGINRGGRPVVDEAGSGNKSVAFRACSEAAFGKDLEGFRAGGGAGFGNDRVGFGAGGGSGFQNDRGSFQPGSHGAEFEGDDFPLRGGALFRDDDALETRYDGRSINHTKARVGGLNDLDIGDLVSSILRSANDTSALSTGLSADDGTDIVDRIVRDITLVSQSVSDKNLAGSDSEQSANCPNNHFGKRVGNDFGSHYHEYSNKGRNDGSFNNEGTYNNSVDRSYSQRGNNSNYDSFEGNRNRVALNNYKDNRFGSRDDSSFQNRGNGEYNARGNNWFVGRNNAPSRGGSGSLFSRRDNAHTGNGDENGVYGGNQGYQDGFSDFHSNKYRNEPYNKNQGRSSGYSR